MLGLLMSPQACGDAVETLGRLLDLQGTSKFASVDAMVLVNIM